MEPNRKLLARAVSHHDPTRNKKCQQDEAAQEVDHGNGELVHGSQREETRDEGAETADRFTSRSILGLALALALAEVLVY